MIVLVVDDQVSVVSAIVSGVRWEAIGVSKVLTAYNSFEAKTILRTQPVDILLCDIEMPGENGLQLFRWAKEGKYDLECIFLTSHADFHYAKEALKLGGMDYILQPARYEDVQAAVGRAAQRVQEKREERTFQSYGKLIQNQRGLLLDSVLGKYLWADRVDVAQVAEDLQLLNLDMEAGAPFCLALLQALSLRDNDELFRYGLSNILTEISNQYGQNALLLRYEAGGYICLLYHRRDAMDPQVFLGFLEHFVNAASQYLSGKLAAYSAGRTDFPHLPQALKQLSRLRDENVAGAPRVFSVDASGVAVREMDFLSEKRRWDLLVSQDDFKAMAQDVEDTLDSLAAQGKLSAAGLNQIYQYFVQLVFRALALRGWDARDIFEGPEEWQRFMTAYRSLDEVKGILRRMGEVFGGLQGSGDDNSQIEAMVRYIHDNIEKDIHRGDVAASVYLSPDYVSHLFRDKLHMSFSDFVITEKMKLARTLLRTGNLPVSVIAAKVGYTNFSYFSRTYKKVFGRTPASERKHAQPE